MKRRPAAQPRVDRYGDLAALAESRGGFFRKGTLNAAAFIPGDDRLVVTFDDQRHATAEGPRVPADFTVLSSALGVSVLGVMAETRNWFREDFVHDLFDGLSGDGFFGRFRQVLFLGAGMGGFAAVSYSRAAPGASVLAIAPQSTMDRRIVPDEARWKWTARLDWSGRYADARDALASSDRVTLITDRCHRPDRIHVGRLRGPNVTCLNAPFFDREIATYLRDAGLLATLVRASLAGPADPSCFAQMLRARHGSPAYRKKLARTAETRGRPTLAARVLALDQRTASSST